MCHDVDSLPAILRSSDAPIESERIVLTAADGATFAAASARPRGRVQAGVIVLPDNRGLSGFYVALAEILAESGYAACAIDYFGRTAGLEDRRPDFQVMEHLPRLTRAGLEADLSATVGYLRSNAGGACTKLCALGFCFGGRQAFLAATLGHDLAGVAGFYGFPGTIFGAPGPTQRAEDIKSPVLAIWGGADDGIPASEISAFEEALTGAGVANTMITYPGAPHSFFDLRQTDFMEASADAWARTHEFITQCVS